MVCSKQFKYRISKFYLHFGNITITFPSSSNNKSNAFDKYSMIYVFESIAPTTINFLRKSSVPIEAIPFDTSICADAA